MIGAVDGEEVCTVLKAGVFTCFGWLSMTLMTMGRCNDNYSNKIRYESKTGLEEYDML